MRRTLIAGFAVAVTLALCANAHAQFQLPPDSPIMKMMLLNSNDVRKDILLTEEQGKQVDDLADRASKLFQDFQGGGVLQKLQDLQTDLEKFLKDGLKAEQSKRLEQIAVQQQGGAAFREKKLAEALKLSDEQKKKFKELDAEMQKAIREATRGGGGFDPAKLQETLQKTAEIRVSFTEKYTKELTDEQKKVWQERAGEPFKGKIELNLRRP